MSGDPELFDVVVVGCGPSGSTTAFLLASRGFRVALVEKERLPRRKVCGGGVSQKTLRELPVPIDPVVEQTIGGGFVSFGPDRSIFRRLDGVGVMVRREAFDDYLARKAEEAGARLEDGCPLRSWHPRADGLLDVETERWRFGTRVLVGADGATSRVRASLFPGRRVRAAAAIEARVRASDSFLERLGGRCVFDFGAVEGGYGWIFPKSDHLNVGLYRYRTTPENADLRRAFQRFRASHPFLRGQQVEDVRGGLVPVRPVSRRLARDGVLLVGDAAGLGEAFWGEGIFHAVRSGRLAAECIEAHFVSGRPLEDYSRRLRRLRADLAFSRLLASAWYRRPRAGFERLVRVRFTSDLFEREVAGTLTPAECCVRVAATVPLWLLGRRDPVEPLRVDVG